MSGKGKEYHGVMSVRVKINRDNRSESGVRGHGGCEGDAGNVIVV